MELFPNSSSSADQQMKKEKCIIATELNFFWSTKTELIQIILETVEIRFETKASAHSDQTKRERATSYFKTGRNNN